LTVRLLAIQPQHKLVCGEHLGVGRYLITLDNLNLLSLGDKIDPIEVAICFLGFLRYLVEEEEHCEMMADLLTRR
jgi:hypothetical protein